MKFYSLTVGTSPIEIVPDQLPPTEGCRLLARAANSGAIYYGLNASVTTSTGTPVSKGPPEDKAPTTIPARHFTLTGGADRCGLDTAPRQYGRLFVVASAAGQVLDVSIG